MMADTDETIRDLLQSIANKLSYMLCDISIRPISTDGANFSSKLYEATISAPDKPDVELFAKIGVIGEDARAVIDMDIYAREFVFYDEVLTEYRRLEDKHGITERNRLRIAKYYGCNKEYLKESIVLENLLKKGFVCHDRFRSVDWAYACESVKQLAILHASSIAYAQESPREFEEVVEKLEFVYPKRFFENVTNSALAVVKEDYRERFSNFLKENLRDEKFESFFKPGKITVLNHGDFRPSNLMHRVLDNGELEIAVLDFQTLQVGNPALDLLYYITNGSDEEFRKQYYHPLIKQYYVELRSAIQERGLDPDKIYPKEDFEYDLKQVLPYGLLIAIFTLPFVTVDTENVTSVDEYFEYNCLGLQTSALFPERLNGLISDYIQMGLL